MKKGVVVAICFLIFISLFTWSFADTEGFLIASVKDVDGVVTPYFYPRDPVVNPTSVESIDPSLQMGDLRNTQTDKFDISVLYDDWFSIPKTGPEYDGEIISLKYVSTVRAHDLASYVQSFIENYFMDIHPSAFYADDLPVKSDIHGDLTDEIDGFAIAKAGVGLKDTLAHRFLNRVESQYTDLTLADYVDKSLDAGDFLLAFSNDDGFGEPLGDPDNGYYLGSLPDEVDFYNQLIESIAKLQKQDHLLFAPTDDKIGDLVSDVYGNGWTSTSPDKVRAHARSFLQDNYPTSSSDDYEAILFSAVNDALKELLPSQSLESSTVIAQTYDTLSMAPCKTCYPEQLGPLCFDDNPQCILIPLLITNFSDSYADEDQVFCEGVFGVGRNTEKGDIRLERIPGYSGIHFPDESLGRDWFRNSTPGQGVTDPGFSPQMVFPDEDTWGDCCGNDIPLDIGVLRPDFGTFYENNLNGAMCMPLPVHPPQELPATSENPIPSSLDSSDYVMIWNSASGDPFTIRKINRSGILYDAVSNYENWFVCDASSSSGILDNLYQLYTDDGDPTTTDPPRLPEFTTLPQPSVTVGYGTTSTLGPASPNADGEGPIIGQGTSPNSGAYGSRSEVIDADSFDNGVSVFGPAFSDPCDLDGDGYDGLYTQDPLYDGSPVNPNIPGSPNRYNEDCDTPEAPYDCDESNANHYPGSTLYCSEISATSDINCNGQDDGEEYCLPDNAYGPDCSIDSWDPDTCTISPQDFSKRFMCFTQNIDKDTQKGSFAECCGFSLEFCNNPNPDGRREGSYIKTLREFQTYPGASPPGNECGREDINCVLRYAINKPAADSPDVENEVPYSLGFSSLRNDIKIKDWRSFKYLEFYIYYAANYVQNIKIGKLIGNPNLIEGYSYYFDEPIINYVVNEPQLGKWLHVVIPIDEFLVPPDQVDIIILYASAKDIFNAGGYVTLPGDTNQYSNIIGLDKIHLVGDDGDRICTGTVDSQWISNLDNSSSPGGSESYDQLGRAACNSIPSFGWTGGHCCGDDNGNNTFYTDTPSIIKRVGDDTFKEFYNDSEAGCWAGNTLVDGERAMLVQYNLTDQVSGLDQKIFNKTCTKVDGCIYSIPQVPGLMIENPNPELYDLVIVSGTGVTRERVNSGTILSNASAPGALLKSERVPLQVQYNDGRFETCNAAPYIFDLINTNDGEDLISPEFNYSSCQVSGNYFCDHSEGTNRGWSDVRLKTYVSSNITFRDGTSIILKDYSLADPINSTDLPPAYRSEEKKVYNMIPNGGFERIR